MSRLRASGWQRRLEILEAARMPKLRAVVRQRQIEDRGFLEQFHAGLGSRAPAVDAEISYSLLLGLEEGARCVPPSRGIRS